MKFYKYYANGNDFVIFTDSKKANRSELAKTLCDRHSGIGADGLIVILPNLNMENLKAQNANFQAKNIKINEKNPTLQDKIKAKSENFDFEWEFYNCDGSDAFMCGNGSRAAAHFARHILGFKNALKFKTKAGIIAAKVEGNEVEVRLTPVKNEREVEFAGLSWLGCDTGVPHLVHFCEDLREFDPKICKKVRDKFNANVNFAKIVNENLIKVRTFERGVEGETMACGTGMAACFYLALKSKFIENKCQIEPKSKEKVFLKFDGENIYFKGLVRCCFEANYNF